MNDVLGAPLNHTSGEEENAKESVLDKVSPVTSFLCELLLSLNPLQVVEVVSDAAHSVAETITGMKPDLVLKHG